METHFLAALLITALPLSSVLSQITQPPSLISVTGTAEVKVAPDEIDMSLGVETRHLELAEATRQNDQQVANALGYAKTSGIPAKDIQTDCITVEPVYNQMNNSQQTTPIYYIVRKSIEIKLTNTTTFDGVITGMLAHGVNYVHGVDFRTTELRKYRDQARAMASRAAREKADAMAAELGVKRGKAYSINANDWSGYNGGYNGVMWGGSRGMMMQNAVQNAGGAPDSTGDTVSIGQISVSASVNVSFLIQ
jgi:uncharacterized protein